MESNPNKKHWVKEGKYICQGSCSITKTKVAKTLKEVNCKNCIKLLKAKVKGKKK